MSTHKDKLLKFYQENGILELSKVTGLTIKELVDLLNLNFKTFEDIDFQPHYGFVVGRIMFENGYGASVIGSEHSYGGSRGLYELAQDTIVFLTILDNDGKLTYDTPITEDVFGYLSPKEVTNYLIKIQDLK
jgi:hypothetical protein